MSTDACKAVLTKAIELTTGDRAKDYGDMFETHQRIANIFNAITGRDLTSKDIVFVHMATKLARMKTSPNKLDHPVDLAAYAGIWYECWMEEEFLFEKKEIEEHGLVGPNGLKR